MFNLKIYFYFFLTGRTYCQDQEEVDEEDMEAEQDELLIECAGDLLTHFGKVIPPEEFAHFFQNLLPFILERLVRITLKKILDFFSFLL